MKCEYCGEDSVLGAVRCEKCGRLLPLSGKAIQDLKAGKGDFAYHEELLSERDRKMLHSWEEAQRSYQTRFQERIEILTQRVLNMFIGSLILVVVCLFGLYLLTVTSPETAADLQKWLLQEEELKGDVVQIYGLPG